MKAGLAVFVLGLIMTPDALPAAVADARLGCMRDADPAACRIALRSDGGDAELASAAGDVLMQARQAAEAILAYRRAQRLGFADQESLNARIAGAESKRLALRAVCESGADESARHACDAALLPGAADEAKILRRRAEISEALRRPGDALDDLLAAQRLTPQDQEVATAILRLGDVTRRDDVATLTGRGSALLALGRPADAVIPLQRALAHDPDSRPVQSLLQSAKSRIPAELPQDPSPQERRFSNSAPASHSH